MLHNGLGAEASIR